SPVLADHQAKGVVDLIAAIERTLSLHLVDQLLTALSQLVVIEVLIPQVEVFNAGEDVAVADHVERGRGDLKAPTPARNIAGRSILNDLDVIVIKHRAGHTERLEDI